MQLFLMMNNYFHDLASALFFTSAIVILFLARTVERTGQVEAIRYFVDRYLKLAVLARVSLAWIVVGGIVRLLTFADFEWAAAVDKNQEPSLILKFVIILSVVGIGAYKWRQLSNKIKELRASLESAHVPGPGKVGAGRA